MHFVWITEIRVIITKEGLEVFGDFKIGGQVICTVKYADDLVLLAKEEKVLQCMVDRLKLEEVMEWK
jgi:hypothetical protein